ncbi:PD-(D/E)XK nuclease-like domain-containing protein (plasmid) [Azospirillum sp. HJ39]|uniref:PD-(D/E)XK nuclease-like domain-containing protein n=1 Tax=Azospirillum sp. HJ39 TaxID=3159496 RepID=UPI003555FCDA
MNALTPIPTPEPDHSSAMDILPPSPPVPVPKPGLYDRIPEDQYHASPGVSVSRLKIFAKAPAKARYGQNKETDSLRFGSLIHTAVLEPAELDLRYMVTDLERFDPRTGDFKEEILKAKGRELVKRAEYEEALRIQDAVHAHPSAGALLRGDLRVEQSFYWIDPETGLLCRGRADSLRMELHAIVDLKSAADASPDPRGFAKSCGEYKYHWQDAYYREGIEAVTGWQPEAFVFIAVEKERPYLVATYELEPAAIERGREDVHEQLRLYAKCLKDDYWPGYSGEIEPLAMPSWAYA